MTDDELRIYIGGMDKFKRREVVNKLMKAKEYEKLQRYSKIWAQIENGKKILFGDKS